VLLHQLWSNLLKNAIEALELTKGTKNITIKLYTLNNIPTVEFCNNGPQINEEEKEKIFENLYTTKEKFAGLGLGIVKNVIDAHRAKIELNSTPKRTCFKIIFVNESVD
jgi:signal transduction histidine kinase